MALLRFRRLRKELGLFDVYVISTGAMISSGFFLLPSLAAHHAGPSVVLAYLLAGVLVLPALLSKAELATAMPRAGGTYYFLDRTLGPLMGVIGGVGTWLTLLLKSAFALIGMGAYLALVWEVPIQETAIGVTLLLAGLNIAGARESSGLMRILVITLLAILSFFIFHGLMDALAFENSLLPKRRFSPFAPNGLDGVLGAVGLVFVSYIGLTKTASLAEEIQRPERSIPVGMGLALLTVTVVYVVGVYVMVITLGVGPLTESLTPAAATAATFTTWLPGNAAVWIIVVGAVLAFAAAGNAGILAASRYPLAMARDRLIPGMFAKTGGRGVPVRSVLLTAAALVGFLLVLDVEQVAKLASALQLIIFGLISVAVIVMRESRIESYDPGFRSPGYPWVQLAGIVIPLVLVAEMGWLPVVFSVGVITLCFGWYTYYARPRIERAGALFHVFERLGRRRFPGLDRELRDIMKEKGVRVGDPFDQVVARAYVLDVPDSVTLEDLVSRAADRLAGLVRTTAEELENRLGRGVQMGGTPVAHGAALLHTRLPGFEGSELLLVRSAAGVTVDPSAGIVEQEMAREAGGTPIHAVFFLVSGQGDPGQHLRILAQLAGRVEDDEFMGAWLAGASEQALKELLLRDERFLSIEVAAGTPAQTLVDKALQDVALPEGCLVALIQRGDESIVPRGSTLLREGDRLTVIGHPAGLAALARRWRRS